MELPTAIGRMSPGLDLGMTMTLGVSTKYLEAVLNLFLEIILEDSVRYWESLSSAQNITRKCLKVVPQCPAPEQLSVSYRDFFVVCEGEGGGVVGFWASWNYFVTTSPNV